MDHVFSDGLLDELNRPACTALIALARCPHGESCDPTRLADKASINTDEWGAAPLWEQKQWKRSSSTFLYLPVFSLLAYGSFTRDQPLLMPSSIIETILRSTSIAVTPARGMKQPSTT